MRVGPYENNCLHLLTSRLYSSEVAKLVTYLNKDCGIDINEQNLLGQVPIQLLPSMFAHSQVNSLLTQLLGLKADVYHKSKNGQSYFGYILQTDINTAEKIIENSGVDIRAMKFDQNQNIFHLLFTHHAASLIEHKSARRYRSNDSTARRSLFLKLLNDESTWDLLQQPDDQGISPLMVLYSSAPLNCKKFIDEYDNFVEYFIDEPMSTDDAAVPLQYLTRIQKFDTPFYTYYLSNTKTHLMEKDEKAPGKPTILHQLIQHSTIKTITKFFKVLQDNAEQEEIVEFVNEKLEAKEDDMQQDGKTALVLAAEEGDITLMGNLIAHGAKVEACAPYNLVQIFVDKKWYYSALAIMCEGDYAKVDFSAELFTSVLAKLMAVDTELRDEVIIDGLEMLLKRVEKQKLLELLLCIPDVQNSTEMEYAFADHCSILQLVCFGKRKTLFDWIFDTFDLTDQALLAAVDSKYDNNILHFVCTSKLSFLAPKPILEEGQVDELRKQERPREGKRNDQAHAKQMMLKLYEFDAVKNKDLLNQPNKRQDTPVHISCMCSMQMLWAEMVNLGANMDLKNVDDKFPRELLINDSTIKAYNRVVKGGQSAAVAKKEAKPKAATKRATRSTNKRKRTAQEEEDEESAQEEEEEEPPKKNRRTTRSRK
jgi:ankyrin repeat protein